MSEVEVGGAAPRGRSTAALRGEVNLSWRVIVFSKCQVVSLNSILIPPNYTLAVGLGVRSVIKTRVELEHACEIGDRLLVLLLLLGQAGPRVDQHGILVVIHVDLSFDFVRFLEAQQPVVLGAPRARLLLL